MFGRYVLLAVYVTLLSPWASRILPLARARQFWLHCGCWLMADPWISWLANDELVDVNGIPSSVLTLVDSPWFSRVSGVFSRWLQCRSEGNMIGSRCFKMKDSVFGFEGINQLYLVYPCLMSRIHCEDIGPGATLVWEPWSMIGIDGSRVSIDIVIAALVEVWMGQ